MKLLIGVIFAFIVGVSCEPVAAQELQEQDQPYKVMTAKFLHHVCVKKDGALSRGACLGYIQGVVDTAEVVYDPKSNKKGQWLCHRPSTREIENAVIDYVRAHPEMHRELAVDVISEVLERAFGTNCPPDTAR